MILSSALFLAIVPSDIADQLLASVGRLTSPAVPRVFTSFLGEMVSISLLIQDVEDYKFDLQKQQGIMKVSTRNDRLPTRMALRREVIGRIYLQNIASQSGRPPIVRLSLALVKSIQQD